MAKNPIICGGFDIGVICEATADSVNVDDAVSTCGQLWECGYRPD